MPDALTGALAALAEGMQRLGEGTRLPRGEVLARLPTRVGTTGCPLDLDPAAVVRLGLAATLLDTELDPRTGEPGGLLRFYHHQLQEFFAARALLEAGRRGLDLRDRWAAPRFKSEMPDPGRLRDDEPLPPPPTTGWEESTLLAVGLARDPAALIAAVRGCNPVLAARCLMDPGVPALPEEIERTRAALLAELSNPAVHLRARIAAGEALGRLGDPRFAVPAGEGVRVLLPPLVEVPAGAVRLGSSWWEVRRLSRAGFPAGDERPRRRVRLAAFAIGRFPVSVWCCPWRILYSELLDAAPACFLFFLARSRAREPVLLTGDAMAIKDSDQPGVHIGGSVTVHGDFVGRDQFKTIHQSQEGASVADLVRLLAEVRALLPQAGLDPDSARAIEGDFRIVEEQAAKAEPKSGLIKSRLNSAMDLIQGAGKTSEALEKIAVLVGRVAAMAAGIF